MSRIEPPARLWAKVPGEAAARGRSLDADLAWLVHTNRRSKTVLVIDDNPGIRGYLETALQRFGYGVLTAHTGHEGLAVAGEQVVDAILLDLAMPDLSGLAVLQELKRQERTRKIPVLLVSGFASLVPPQRVQEATAVIQKPFRLGDLLAQLERALG